MGTKVYYRLLSGKQQLSSEETAMEVQLYWHEASLWYEVTSLYKWRKKPTLLLLNTLFKYL